MCSKNKTDLLNKMFLINLKYYSMYNILHDIHLLQTWHQCEGQWMPSADDKLPLHLTVHLLFYQPLIIHEQQTSTWTAPNLVIHVFDDEQNRAVHI